MMTQDVYELIQLLAKQDAEEILREMKTAKTEKPKAEDEPCEP